MNKQDWTYKKLGEVCVDKKQIVRASSLFMPNEIINYIDISSIDNSQNVITSTTPIIFDEAPSRAQQVVNIGDVLISLVRPNLRNIAIVNSQNDNLVASSGFCILRTNGHVNNRYIFYIVRGEKFTNHLLSRVQGANYPAVREDDIKNYLLPVPPLAEQERIVAELDLLSGVIEKKKEQLKAYDQLAQSIFYTMFGDPIDNPKGWEVKKMGEVCSLKAGKAIKAAELKEKQDNLYPCYGGNGIRGFIDKVSHKEDFPIIGRQGALCGNVNYAKGPFYATEHAVVVTPLIEMNKIWLFYELKCSNLEQYAHGVAQPGIAVNDLNPIHFPLPPLSLQQQFAEKVEAIERQKALVQQSIEETQTMFDYTMDKYFG